MRSLRSFAVPVAVAWLASPLWVGAQLAPVRLTVNRQQVYRPESSRRDEVWVDWSTGQLTTSETATAGYRRTGVVCSIAVDNNGMKPLTDVRVRWALFVRQDERHVFVREGSKDCSVDVGREFVFKTDVLAGPSWETKEVGYWVEAVIDGKVVATAMDPPDARDIVERWRARRTP